MRLDEFKKMFGPYLPERLNEEYIVRLFNAFGKGKGEITFQVTFICIINVFQDFRSSTFIEESSMNNLSHIPSHFAKVIWRSMRFFPWRKPKYSLQLVGGQTLVIIFFSHRNPQNICLF